MNRDELRALLAEHMADRSNIVQNWPQDEQDAYHAASSFAHGNEAVERIRIEKATDAILAWFEDQATEEWGVQYESDSFVYETSDDKDWLIDECITGVYDEGETPPKLMSRWTTAWKETR